MCMAIVEVAGSFHVENVDELYTDQYDYKKPKWTDVVVAEVVFMIKICCL